MSSPTRSRAAAAFSRSRTSRMRSASSGTSEANSMASTTSIGLGTRRVSFGDDLGFDLRFVPGFDHDVPEQLRLLGPDLALAAELEDGKQRHHDLGAFALAADHGAEEQ